MRPRSAAPTTPGQRKRSSATKVEYCRKHPDTPLKPINVEGLDLKDCPQCAAEAHQSQADQERTDREEAAREKIRNRWKHLAIGRRYRNITFESYSPTCPEAAEAKEACVAYAKTFSDRLEAGDSLLLYGSTGTGKNHLAAAISRNVIAQNYTVVHAEMDALLWEIRKKGWGKDGDERAAIEDLLEPDLLVIDEVFSPTKEHEIRWMLAILHRRYKELRPTIIITNLDMDQLEVALGPHIVDRFWEGGSSILHFTWQSYRRRS